VLAPLTFKVPLKPLQIDIESDIIIGEGLTIIIVVWTFIYMVVSQLYSIWRFKHNIIMAAADSRTTAVLADTITNQNNIELFKDLKPVLFMCLPPGAFLAIGVLMAFQKKYLKKNI
jgi:hypothetical protein